MYGTQMAAPESMTTFPDACVVVHQDRSETARSWQISFLLEISVLCTSKIKYLFEKGMKLKTKFKQYC